MTAYFILIILSMLFSFYTFWDVIPEANVSAFVKGWMLWAFIGLAVQFIIVIPLMEWSGFLFWTFLLMQGAITAITGYMAFGGLERTFPHIKEH